MGIIFSLLNSKLLFAKQNRVFYRIPARIVPRSAIDASQLPGNMLYNSYELQTDQQLLSLYLPPDSLKLQLLILILSKSEIALSYENNFSPTAEKSTRELIQEFQY
jgi:hypothetical protein